MVKQLAIHKGDLKVSIVRYKCKNVNKFSNTIIVLYSKYDSGIIQYVKLNY